MATKAKATWCLSVAFREPVSTDLTLFVECLRYMGAVKVAPPPMSGFSYNVIIRPPKHITGDSAKNTWAHENAKRIATFGPSMTAKAVEVLD